MRSVVRSLRQLRRVAQLHAERHSSMNRLIRQQNDALMLCSKASSSMSTISRNGQICRYVSPSVELLRSRFSTVVADSIKEHINVNALYGIRIKTWQGGKGTVRNVTFSNVRVVKVATPIAIDQFYCDGGVARCRNRTDAVQIAGVAYRRVVGTYTYQPVHLACSDARPCTGVNMADVRLSPASESAGGALRKPLCWKSYGEALGMIEPMGIGCLQRSNGFVMPLTKPFNYTC